MNRRRNVLFKGALCKKMVSAKLSIVFNVNLKRFSCCPSTQALLRAICWSQLVCLARSAAERRESEPRIIFHKGNRNDSNLYLGE